MKQQMYRSSVITKFHVASVSHYFCKVNDDKLPKGNHVRDREGDILDNFFKEYMCISRVQLIVTEVLHLHKCP